jgi:oligopeptidase B
MTRHHPPLAPIHPQRIEAQGDVRIDNYFWLRNRTDPAVLDYLHAENAYTTGVMQHTEALQAQLYRELRGRIQEADLSVPVRLGDYLYYQRTEEGQQYPIHCRKFQQMTANEEVLLDVNALAVGHEYTEIGNFQVSPDQRLLAYSLDTAGDEIYTLYVKDLATGALLSERITNTYYGLEWGNDNRTLFYTVLNEAKRAYRVFRHQLGGDAANDELVYEEADANFHLYLHKSKSDAYLLITLDSPTTSEVWFLDAGQPSGRFRVVQPRQHGVEYSVSHHDNRFFITTNAQATNFRVVSAPVATPDQSHWQEFIAHRETVTVERTEAFRHHLVIYEREGGLRHLRIRHLTTGEDHRVALPDAAYSCGGSWNPDFERRVLRFTYSSLVTPESVYDYDMDQRTLTLLKQEAVLGGYDASHYHTARLWASAADGVQVPITIVHRQGVVLNGNNPLLLRGYGSYGSNNDPEFTANILSLLDRGFVFALAHIRGGGEMGRRWYESGKLLH